MMVSSPFPIILTTHSLPSLCPPPTIESDCKGVPIPRDLQSNGACAVSNLTLLPSLPSPLHNYHLAPSLFLTPLTDEFVLAFNPEGQAGVVVLNQAALAVLDAFREPPSLLEPAHLDPGHSDAAQRLAALELLVPWGQSHPKQADTYLLTAWLHVTNACNLACPYCYLHKTPDALELETGRRSIDAIFRSATLNGFRAVKIKYAGGESSLNFPLLVALHRYAQQLAHQHDLALQGVVLSNGVAWGDRMIETLKELNLHLMISLDGVGAFHDIQRPFVNGRGSWFHVERTLDRLDSHQVRPSVSVTLSNRNLAGLPETVAYLLQRELPFTLNFYRENDCSASITDLRYQEAQLIAAMRAAFAVIETALPPYSLLGTLSDRARLDAPHQHPCGVGHSYLVINQRGAVAKCHMEIDDLITDITILDPLAALRTSTQGVQNPSVEEKQGCRDCTWRYNCAGGCPALTYRMTGRYDVKSPNCTIYQSLFPDILRLEGLRLLRHSTLPQTA